MDKKFVELLLEGEGGDGLRKYEGYSGRGMYGSTTTGVVGSFKDFFSAVGELNRSLVDDAIDCDTANTDEEEYEQRCDELQKLSQLFSEALRNLRWDNLGLEFIFY